MKSRAQDHAQRVKMAVRLATPVPISIAKALSVAGVGGNGEPAHSAGSQAHGNCTALWGFKRI